MIGQDYGLRSRDGVIGGHGGGFAQGRTAAGRLVKVAERTIRRGLIILALGGIVVAGNSTAVPRALAAHVDARTAWWGQLHCVRAHTHHASCKASPSKRSAPKG